MDLNSIYDQLKSKITDEISIIRAELEIDLKEKETHITSLQNQLDSANKRIVDLNTRLQKGESTLSSALQLIGTLQDGLNEERSKSTGLSLQVNDLKIGMKQVRQCWIQ